MAKLSPCKLARMQQGLKLKDLSARTGYHISTLSNLEHGNGRSWPKIELAVSRVLGLPRELLFSKPAQPDVSMLLKVLIQGSDNGEKK